MDYRATLTHLIEVGDGTVVEDRFVTRPGVLVWSVTRPTHAALAVLADLNIEPVADASTRLAAFDARLTYLSFKDTLSDETAFVSRVLKMGHDSIYDRQFVTVLVAGVSLETVMEVVSHPSARIARLTSSNTKAMDQCLYRVSPKTPRSEQLVLTSVLQALHRATLNTRLSRYVRNRLKPGARVGAFTVGMTLREWNWVLGSRLQLNGNEPEVIELMERICALLQPIAPLLIKTPAEYRGEESHP